jgi:hypothetical protein
MKPKKAAQQMVLIITEEKAKFMEVSNNKTNEKHVIIDNINTDKVNEFQYLGSIVACDKNINVEINHTGRITMGNKCYLGMQT